MIRPCVLTIAGSDSGGGAGIQADLKTLAAFGVHGASAITVVTAQNSRGVTALFPLPDSIVEAQIDAVMTDLAPNVIKIGMLGNARLVSLVARKLRQWQPGQIILDPVMVASSGESLLEEDAVESMRSELLPVATVITPNWPEAGVLIDAFPRGLEDVARIVISLQRIGVRAGLIKGGHVPGTEVVDTLFEGTDFIQFTNPRIPEAEGHGTGCSLASALAAGIALGLPLREAAGRAIEFVHQALRQRYAVGASKSNFLGILGTETTARSVSSQ